MSKRIEVVYENGVLRPLEPLMLRDNQRVSIVIADDVSSPTNEDWLDNEYVRSCDAEADEAGDDGAEAGRREEVAEQLGQAEPAGPR